MIGLSGATGWAGKPHLHFQMNTFEGNMSVPIEFADLDIKGPMTTGQKIVSKNTHRLQTGRQFSGSESKMSPSHFYLNGVDLVSPLISWWKGLPIGGEVHFEGEVSAKFENKFLAAMIRYADKKNRPIAIQIVPVNGRKFTVDLKYSEDMVSSNEPVYLVFQAISNRNDPIIYTSHWGVILK